MEFCNKGMVRADPPPLPVMVKDHKFTFFLDPSLNWFTILGWFVDQTRLQTQRRTHPPWRFLYLRETHKCCICIQKMEMWRRRRRRRWKSPYEDPHYCKGMWVKWFLLQGVPSRFQRAGYIPWASAKFFSSILSTDYWNDFFLIDFNCLCGIKKDCVYRLWTWLQSINVMNWGTLVMDFPDFKIRNSAES